MVNIEYRSGFDGYFTPRSIPFCQRDVHVIIVKICSRPVRSLDSRHLFQFKMGNFYSYGRCFLGDVVGVFLGEFG